jgi:hypothetical protein
MKDKKQKLLYSLRIGLIQGKYAVPIPKHQFKKGELVNLPTRDHTPRLQSTERNQIILLTNHQREQKKSKMQIPKKKPNNSRMMLVVKPSP